MDNRQRLKVVALDSDLDQEVSRAHKALYNGDPEPLRGCYSAYGFDLVQVCLALNASRRKRAQRCKAKIGDAISTGSCYFLTLTFTDEVLSKTTQETRRRYVSRYLKSIAPVYVGNIDFGDKKKNPESHEREHYHAVAVCGVRPKKGGWRYGFTKIKEVGDTEDDLTKVSKYTAKLSMHALKASTSKGAPKCPRLIYSRNCLE